MTTTATDEMGRVLEVPAWAKAELGFEVLGDAVIVAFFERGKETAGGVELAGVKDVKPSMAVVLGAGRNAYVSDPAAAFERGDVVLLQRHDAQSLPLPDGREVQLTRPVRIVGVFPDDGNALA